MDESYINDVSSGIVTQIRHPLASLGDEYHLEHFGGFRAQITGQGTVTYNGYDLANANVLSGSFIPPVAKRYPVEKLMNYVGEKFSLEFTVSSADSWINLLRTNLYSKAVWESRPL